MRSPLPKKALTDIIITTMHQMFLHKRIVAGKKFSGNEGVISETKFSFEVTVSFTTIVQCIKMPFTNRPRYSIVQQQQIEHSSFQLLHRAMKRSTLKTFIET